MYRLLTDLGAPFITLYLRRRMARGREDKARFPERLGQTSQPRPTGKLVWIHAASVGEAMSVLSLIHALRKQHTAWTIVLTTGTVTSARLLASRLPDGVIHQYMPVDRWLYVTRFLDHWKPDLALWVESELWPNMLTAMRERHIPTLLLNGRMSAQSFRIWCWFKPWARKLLSTFTLCLTQTEQAKAYFTALGARDVRYIGNLKYAAEALPYDKDSLAAMKTHIGDRPLWMMAQTHAGEDEIAIAAHKTLRAQHSNLLTILVPRHPARRDAIIAMIKEHGLHVACRTHADPITLDTDIYLADTMGELGFFYHLAKIVCIGGSFVWGGHNPIEAARSGCAILFGERMTNFAEIAQDMLTHHAAIQVPNSDMLADKVHQLLTTPALTTELSAAALRVVERHGDVLDKTLDVLAPWFTLSAESTKSPPPF